MVHWKAFQDCPDYLEPHEIEGEKEVTISRVAAGKTVDGKNGMFMYFSHNGKELPKKWHVPKSVRFALSKLINPDVDKWAGQKITLYQTYCKAFGEIEPCIRVKLSSDARDKVLKWMKKRGSSHGAYECEAPK